MYAGRDEELVRRSLGGEEGAFASLYHRHRKAVYSAVYRVMRNREESEDAVQEVFVKAYRSLAHWDPERARFSTWLKRLASNHAIDCWRVSHRRNSRVVFDGDTTLVLLNLRGHEASPARELERKEQARALLRCIEELPKMQKRIFVLRHLRGWKLREIADREQLCLGTIKASLFRATRSVRRRLSGASCDPLHLSA